MTRSKRALGWILSILLFSALIPISATAQSEWLTLYQEKLGALRSENGALKRVVWFFDVTGDGTPEMIHLGMDAKANAELDVYAIRSEKVVKCSGLDTRTLAGVKGATAQQRLSASGELVMSMNLSAFSGGVSSVHLIAFKAGANEASLDDIYTSSKSTRKGKLVKATVNGQVVSGSTYVSRQNAFARSYGKKGAQLPFRIITKGDGASVARGKLTQLAKAYATYAKARKITLSKTKAQLAPGDTLNLKAAVSPTTAISDAISWQSSDAAVATVSKGKVTAVAAGQCVVTVRTASGKTASCAITVTGQASAAPTLNTSALSLVKGERYTLLAQGGDGVYAWSSSAPKVATVTQKGVVTALSTGTATISLKSGGKTVKCKVTVTSRAAMIVDISQHNYSDKMDWEKIADNVDLLILRCGVTRTQTAPLGIGVDARFSTYAKKCQSYDIPFGVYYYGKVGTAAEARQEAQMAWKTASPYDPLFYVYDVEEANYSSKAVVDAFIAQLKSLGARKTGLYIAHHLYASLKLDPSIVDFIWLPHYGSNNGSVNSTPSFDCDIHQYSSNGRVSGFPGVVDVNRLMGSKKLSWYTAR